MVKVIELNRSNIARLEDTEPFLLPDNLELQFNAIGYDMRNACISLQNGTIKGQYKFKKNFEVENQFLFAGKLNISVRLYIDGKVAKEWHVLPIKIVETQFGVQAFDYLSDLEERLKALETYSVKTSELTKITEKINELSEKHNELTETVNEIKENY